MTKFIGFYSTWFYRPRILFKGKRIRIGLLNTWSLYLGKYKSAIGPIRIAII